MDAGLRTGMPQMASGCGSQGIGHTGLGKPRTYAPDACAELVNGIRYNSNFALATALMTSGPSPSPVRSAGPSPSDRWTVPTDHPAFAGHFPGRPIVPGVVLLDRVLMLIAEATGHAPEALTLRSVKFLSPVLPGETVVFSHRVAASGAIVFEISVEACAETASKRRPVASGSFVPHGLSGEVAD